MSQTASREYIKNAVMTAKPEQLQVMLLDGAVRFALQGRASIEAGDLEASFNSLDRAQRICLQLAAGLNRDVNPEIADQMVDLYNFCYMRLVEANLHRNIKAIDEAVRVLKHQRETWSLIVEKLSQHAGEQADAAQPQRPASAPPAPTPAAPITDDPDESTVNFEG